MNFPKIHPRIRMFFVLEWMNGEGGEGGSSNNFKAWILSLLFDDHIPLSKRTFSIPSRYYTMRLVVRLVFRVSYFHWGGCDRSSIRIVLCSLWRIRCLLREILRNFDGESTIFSQRMVTFIRRLIFFYASWHFIKIFHLFDKYCIKWCIKRKLAQ